MRTHCQRFQLKSNGRPEVLFNWILPPPTGGRVGWPGPAHFSELPLSKRAELAESHAPCVSVREREAPLQCADRRSHFNYNPFGLRFGKRAQQPAGSLARPRTITFLKLLPLFLNPRELEVANWRRRVNSASDDALPPGLFALLLLPCMTHNLMIVVSSQFVKCFIHIYILF